MFNYLQSSVLAVQTGRGPFRRLTCVCAIFIAFPLTSLLVGCDRIYGLVYSENGHVKGGAMAWQSTTTCTESRLLDLADLAATDVPATRSFSRSASAGFTQEWPAPDDSRGYPKRRIDYFINFSFDQDHSTKMFIYGEATLQRGASMPSTEFNAEYKARVLQYMEALLIRGKECGLSTSAPIKYG